MYFPSTDNYKIQILLQFNLMPYQVTIMHKPCAVLTSPAPYKTKTIPCRLGLFRICYRLCWAQKHQGFHGISVQLFYDVDFSNTCLKKKWNCKWCFCFICIRLVNCSMLCDLRYFICFIDCKYGKNGSLLLWTCGFSHLHPFPRVGVWNTEKASEVVCA